MNIINDYREEVKRTQIKLKRKSFDFFYVQMQISNLVIVGLKKVGKSTLLKQLIKTYIEEEGLSYSDVLYYDFRNNEVSFDEIQVLITKNKFKIVSFSEVQVIEDWVKKCSELTKKFPKTIFTFSSSNGNYLEQNKKIQNWNVYNLNPLSINEYERIWKDNSFDQFLKYGSFPRVDESKSCAIQYLENTEQLVIDIAILEGSTKLIDYFKFKELLRDINNYIGQEMRIRSWSQSAVARNTANIYLKIMIDALLVKRISKLNANKEYTSSKIYFTDKSMIHLFNLKNNETNIIEKIAENCVFNYLDNLYNIDFYENNIYYYNGKNRKGIDFVVPKSKLLINVNYKANINSDNLIKTMDATIDTSFNDFTKIIITKDFEKFVGGWHFITLESLLNYGLEQAINKEK